MFTEFIQNLSANQEVREGYIQELGRSMKLNSVDVDAEELEALFTEGVKPASPLPDSVPLPTVSAHWWGYRIRIHADFLKWIGASGIVVGALVAMLAPILVVLGPIAVAVGLALGAYLMAQHAALLIQANNCGGFVCLEALWVAPYVFVPKCCP